MMAMPNCPVCKKPLPPTMGANARYCSAECRAKRSRTMNIEVNSVPVRECAHCGRRIYLWAGRKDRVYCSIACRVAAHRKKHTSALVDAD
jgi:predicted nucleic acid-binding Zn ribbon protein